MQFDSDNLLLSLLEWAWVALVAMFAALYKKVIGMETRQQLLQQQSDHFEQQRSEDRELRKEERGYYDQRFEKLETLIKNGH